MKLFFKILFFILAIFQVNICVAKAFDFDKVISEITHSNILYSEKSNCEFQDVFLENDFAKTCKFEKYLLAFKSLVKSRKATATKGGQTIIGEGMKRVGTVAAQNPGSVILNTMPKFTGSANQVTSQMMTYNRQWILQQMRSGRPILDIGLDATRANPSIFYQMEQNMMKNYLKLHPNAFQIIK
jgi:hypothetical protein